MSTDILAKVTRDTTLIYAGLPFQIDRMSEVEALAYSQPPNFLYNGFCWGIYDIRQNDYLTDLANTDPITHQAKAYQIVNEPESFDDEHLEFQCTKADRAALARSS